MNKYASVKDEYLKERLNNLKTYSDQRRSNMLQQVVNIPIESPHAIIRRNDIAATTSVAIPATLSALIAGSSKYIKSSGSSPTMRVLKALLSGARWGAGTLGVGSAISGLGSTVGELSKEPHEISLKRMVNDGSAKYVIPGMATYNKSRLHNAIVDREGNVPGNTLIM